MTGVLPASPTTTAVSPAATSMNFETHTTLTATGYDASGNPLTGLAFDWTTANPQIATLSPTSINTALVTGAGTGNVTITATPVRGPASTSAIAVNPGSTIAFDSFTGANGTALTAHTPEVNQMNLPWTVTGAMPTLSSGRLTTTAASFMLLEGGTPNLTATVLWFSGSSPNREGALIFRATDENNCFVLRVWQQGVYLYRVSNGVWTNLWAQDLGAPPEGQHSLQVQLSGSTMTAYWDFGVYLFTTYDTFNSNATKYGVRWTSYDTTTSYDGFRLTGTLPPPPARTAITPGSNAIVFEQLVTLTAKAYDAADVEVPNTSFTWASSNPQVASVVATSAATAQLEATGIGSATITATPNRGPSSTATTTVSPGSTIVFDGFSDGDGVPLALHAPVVNQIGGPWSISGGLTVAVSGHRAGVTGTGSFTSALIDAGTPDATATVLWVVGPASNPDGGLIFRASDPNNFFLLRVFYDQLLLYRVVNNQWTGIWSRALTGVPAMGQHSLQAVLSGSTITVYWDFGVEMVTLSDTFNINATKYGMFWSNVDTTTTYDGFRVTGTLAPPATRVVITPGAGEVPFHGAVTLSATAYDAVDQPISGMNFAWTTSNPSASTVVGTSMSTASVTGMGEGVSTITATPSRGPSGTAILTTNPGTTLVFDSFTGANGTALAAHTPEVTQLDGPWAVFGSPGAALTGNRVGPQGTGGTMLALIEGGAPNATVATTWTPGDGTLGAGYIYGGLLARASDEQNYVTAYVWDVYVILGRMSYGQWVTLGSARMPDDYFRGRTHRLELRVLGSSLEVWLDGDRHIVAMDSFNLGATKYGVSWWNQYDAVSTFDDFSVVGNIPPVVQTLAVTPASLTVAPYETTDLVASARDSSGQTIVGAVVAWASSATGVARVSPSTYTAGTVTPIAEGTATVTARVPRGTAADVSIPLTVRICVDPLSSPSVTVPYGGGNVTVSVSAAGDCSWRAVPLANWLSVATGANGVGNGSITIAVAANLTPLTRTGQVAIGGRLFSVTQPPEPNTCVTGGSAGQTSFTAAGGDGDFGLVADPNCSWAVTSSNLTWLIPIDWNGTGSGSPRFRVLPNDTPWERSATIGVEGNGGFTITQAAGASGEPPPGPPPSALYGRGQTTVKYYPDRRVLEARTSTTPLPPFAGSVQSSACECTLYWRYSRSIVIARLYAPESQSTPVWGQVGIDVQSPWDGTWGMIGDHYQDIEWFTSPSYAPETYYDRSRIYIGESGDQDIVNSSLKLFLLTDGTFNSADPERDLRTFVPGSFADGSSRPAPSALQAIQRVRVIAAYVDSSGAIVTPPANAQVQFSLPSVSQFAGIAMNAPDPRSTEGRDFELVGATSVRFGSQAGALLNTVHIDVDVWDYGGFATVRAAHQGGQTAEMRLPLDLDNNRLPDSGWVSSTGRVTSPQSESEDTDGVPLGFIDRSCN